MALAAPQAFDVHVEAYVQYAEALRDDLHSCMLQYSTRVKAAAEAHGPLGLYHNSPEQAAVSAAFRELQTARALAGRARAEALTLRATQASALHLLALAGSDRPRGSPEWELPGAAQARRRAAACAAILLQRGFPVQAVDSRGKTALHWACRAGSSLLAGVLLDAGAYCAVQGNDGRTPLHEAIASRQLETVLRLLQAGAPPHWFCDKRMRTPLSMAVRWGLTDICTALLFHGAAAEVNITLDATTPESDDGVPPPPPRPLHEAAMRGHAEIVRAMMAVVPPERRVGVLRAKNAEGHDTLYLATRAGHDSVVREVLRHLPPPVAEAVSREVSRQPHRQLYCTPLCAALRRRRAAGCLPLLLGVGCSTLETLLPPPPRGPRARPPPRRPPQPHRPLDHCRGARQRAAVLAEEQRAAASLREAGVARAQATAAEAKAALVEARAQLASHCGEAERRAACEFREAVAAVRRFAATGSAAPPPAADDDGAAAPFYYANGGGFDREQQDWVRSLRARRSLGPQQQGRLSYPEYASLVAEVKSKRAALADRWAALALAVRAVSQAEEAVRKAEGRAAGSRSALLATESAVATAHEAAVAEVAALDAEAADFDSDSEWDEPGWDTDAEMDDMEEGEWLGGDDEEGAEEEEVEELREVLKPVDAAPADGGLRDWDRRWDTGRWLGETQPPPQTPQPPPRAEAGW